MALKRMRQSGVEIVTKESVLFECLRQAGNGDFKQISKEFFTIGIGIE